MSDKNLINLADFIKQLKADLAPLSEDDKPLFYIESVELEAQIVASLEEGGNAGISVKIFGLGADAGVKSTRESISTQTVKISLSPLFSKEELLEKLTDDEKENLKKDAATRVVRGGSGGGHQVTIRGRTTRGG